MQSYLDHVIWACADLEHGARRFEALTGVCPRYGGVHAGGLTHNALVGLGNRCYFEILAPVGPAAPGDDNWCRFARAAHEPRIMTYCLRSPRPLSELASAFNAFGWQNAVVAGNGRTTPEGVRLRWQWLGPTVERFGLAFPFFIDWLDSPHPAETLGPAQPGSEILLQHFAVGHPDAAELSRTLGEIGAAVDTYAADTVQFRVQLQTPLGNVSL
jgi:glyoxalase-like protein